MVSATYNSNQRMTACISSWYLIFKTEKIYRKQLKQRFQKYHSKTTNFLCPHLLRLASRSQNLLSSIKYLSNAQYKSIFSYQV